MGTVVRTGLVISWTSDLVPASPWGFINVDDSGRRFGTAIAYRPSHVWGGDGARVIVAYARRISLTCNELWMRPDPNELRRKTWEKVLLGAVLMLVICCYRLSR